MRRGWGLCWTRGCRLEAFPLVMSFVVDYVRCLVWDLQKICSCYRYLLGAERGGLNPLGTREGKFSIKIDGFSSSNGHCVIGGG